MSDKSNWLIEEDVALLQAWVLVIYDPIKGNEMKVQHIWHKIHAQFFNLDNKKSFTWHGCWNIVKQTQKYKVLPIGPHVQLNETPLHELTTEESPLETPLETPWQPLLKQ
ncbi:unnamed protein product [Malus baccata var. baccata]